MITRFSAERVNSVVVCGVTCAVNAERKNAMTSITYELRQGNYLHNTYLLREVAAAVAREWINKGVLNVRIVEVHRTEIPIPSIEPILAIPRTATVQDVLEPDTETFAWTIVGLLGRWYTIEKNARGYDSAREAAQRLVS